MDPYNTADRYQQIDLDKDDLRNEHDAHRAMAHSSPRRHGTKRVKVRRRIVAANKYRWNN